ncbi:glycosyl hydrolase family 3 C-terminal domain-containing protein [Dactylonectria macrodidyma]|uniref:beta-glucosidase n=1 Tax=Dactylonectria macrodidyma TaxID=307937 RepID=A0A9P9JS15_9HYPO|nr:glycosyl hydrolase family 3 C-terminal domain-containing protein [Dactylonectria macrodidyma]
MASVDIDQMLKELTIDEKMAQAAREVKTSTTAKLYLKPFEIVVKEADPWCLMTAYPKVNGSYIDATPKFMDHILRKDWGYQGLTMSDWGAATTLASVRNGLDLEIPGPARAREASSVRQALEDGRISITDINDRVRNSLKLLERVGGAGNVLLKNKDEILPIDISKVKKIALLGPLARHASAHGGGSAHIFRSLPDLCEGTSTKNGNPGFDVEYYRNHHGTGDPFATQEVLRSYCTTHDQIEIKDTAMSARLSTTYLPTETGSHYFSLSGAGNTKLFIDGEHVAEQKGSIRDAMAFISGVQDELRVQHYLEASKSYTIEVLTSIPVDSVSDNYILDKQLCAHVGFVPQAEMEQQLQAEAVELARDADFVIVFTGNSFQWESEGQDMDAMVLPMYESRTQDKLVSEVAAVNLKAVVVNTTGVAVALLWLDDVVGMVQAWYAGQETGNAILDVLVGHVNPSGRLPISWPRLYEHTACYDNFGIDSYESRKVEYIEGVFVGYRHFDSHWNSEKEVLFPFGFGLSYTKFQISEASVSGILSKDRSQKITVTVPVANVGTREGAETIQVYIAAPQSDHLERPMKTLAGFSKLKLKEGTKQTANIEFGYEAAAYWDENLSKWKVVAGHYRVLVATSSNPKDVISTSPLEVLEDLLFSA